MTQASYEQRLGWVLDMQGFNDNPQTISTPVVRPNQVTIPQGMTMAGCLVCCNGKPKGYPLCPACGRD